MVSAGSSISHDFGTVGAATVGATTALEDRNIDTNTGAVKGKGEGKKWYQSNFFKLAVGVVVVGGAIALACTVGGPILVGMAVGAATGAAYGGLLGGVSSYISGGDFMNGFSNGFMWGGISGAISGAVSAKGIGMLGTAFADGAVDSAIYVGETKLNGGDVSAMGVMSSFAMGMGISYWGSSRAAKRTNGGSNPELSRIDYLRNKYGKLTSEQINNRINLRGATHDKLNEFIESGISGKKLGPAVAGVMDTKTGKIYYGINDSKGRLPEVMDDLISDRIQNMPKNIRDSYIKTKGAGSHAEVNALNEALLAREGANIDDFMIHVISTKGLGPNIPQAGIPMPRCPHCEFITDGVNYFPEVLKYGN